MAKGRIVVVMRSGGAHGGAYLWFAGYGNGTSEWLGTGDLRDVLAKRRQAPPDPSFIECAKPGDVCIPVDLPPPPPMPTGDDATRILVRTQWGDFVWRLPGHVLRGDTVVCTVTVGVDEDGNPTATVVRP